MLNSQTVKMEPLNPSPLVVELITGGTRGLQRDAEVVARVLDPYCQTAINISRIRNCHLLHRRWLKALANRVVKVRRVVLFFEILPTAWTGVGKLNILIPNQEWVRASLLKHISSCFQLWCKTNYATELFTRMGYNTRYIGFSSKDMYCSSSSKDYNRFIHVAGRSHMKGTRSVLELWRRHAEWPPLVVVSSDLRWQQYASHNITIRGDRVNDRELRAMMNFCGVHLCPSETEGFGHYISEGLSTKALIISVDAPPMNELVCRNFGLLAKYKQVEQMGIGERFIVDPVDLEHQVEAAIKLSTANKAAFGEIARREYLRRSEAFKENLYNAFVTVCEQMRCV